MPGLDIFGLDSYGLDGPIGLKNYFGLGGDGVLDTAGNENVAVTANSGYGIKEYTSMTINAGHIMTTTSPCRGLIVRCLGNVLIEGSLNMTEKAGLSMGEKSLMPIWKKNSSGALSAWIWGMTNSYEETKGGAGGNGGASGADANHIVGNAGTGGAGRVNLGGFGGGGGATINSGGGGASYDGGSINYPGMCNANHIPAITSLIGTDGSGAMRTAGASYYGGACFGGGGGGASNSDGLDGAYAGGLIIVIALGNVTISVGANIQCNGGAGGAGDDLCGGGGGAGGGVIKIYYGGTYTNSGTVQCLGGAGGAAGGGSPAGNAGSAGAAGNIITQKII